MEPQVRYARTDDGVSIAYATAGSGPPVLMVPFLPVSHVMETWRFADSAPALLAANFSVTWYDSRGSGLSDRAEPEFTMDNMLLDAEAVIRAAGLETFAVLATWDGVPVSLALAARHPEAVSRLVLTNGWPSSRFLVGTPAQQAMMALRDQDWHIFTETASRVLARLNDDDYARQFTDYWRVSVERDVYWKAADQMNDWDVTGQLSAIHCPTLLMHYRNNGFVPVSASQAIASAVPGARLQITDTMPLADHMDDIRSFLLEGATRDQPPAEPAGLRTVFFTDLVGHTQMMSRLGDERGRDVLREHERITRDVLKAHGGTEVKTMGDGFMASFGSVTRAVECAIALQKAFAERSATAHPEALEGLTVRVGLNAGEPIEEDGDLFGATVILAARIAAKAEGGEILVSDTVRGLCSGKGFLFSDRGDFVAKGFEEPVRLYEVRWQ